MKGVCKLCHLEKDLLKKSHIIPDFMYQFLYDEHHKIRVTTSSEFLKKSPRSSTKSSGDYEPDILCRECDNDVIGGYESYASKAIYSKGLSVKVAPKITSFYNRKGQEWSVCENVDYKLFKLFLLSILWRASISSRPMFSSVKLGPHEETIRRMIHEGDPGKESTYPISMLTTVHEKTFPKDFVIEPRYATLHSHRVYVFPISGMFIMYYVSNHEKPEDILEHTIKKSNKMGIFHIPQMEAWAFIAKFIGAKLVR
jgi:hypothetical protein